MIHKMNICPCVYLRETWDPFNLNPIGAEKESKRKCFRMAQNLAAVVVGLAVLASAIISKVGLSVYDSFYVIPIFITGVEANRTSQSS